MRSIRQRVVQREVLFGTWLVMDSPVAVEIAGDAGVLVAGMRSITQSFARHRRPAG